MNKSNRFLLGAAAAALVALTFPTAGGMPADAACAALGTYTVVANGGTYAASYPGLGASLVLSGSASIVSYSGCGSHTLMHLTTVGPGAQLAKPVTPLLGNTLRSSGDLLLRLTVDAKQDPLAPPGVPSVLLSGTATYAHVTTSGPLHGKQVKLAYSVKTVKIANARAQLRVTSADGGAFSLNAALPGPSIGPVASRFSYFAVGAKNPAKLKQLKTPLSAL